MTRTTGNPLPYGSPAALRAALTDRLKKIAASSRFTVTELHRQFAYDRLLTRVFSGPDSDQWVLKGATALLARLEVARHSKDIDLSRQSTMDLDEAEDALRSAARRDIADYFSFEIGQPTPMVGDKGRRFGLVAVLGGRPFAAFPVDLITAQPMTAATESASALVSTGIPGLLTVDYRVYPLVDHIADKVSACLEVHVHGGAISVSNRYKDLVDLVLIARAQQLRAEDLRRALLAQADRRAIELPTQFAAPGPLWPAGYEAKAKEVPEIDQYSRFSVGLALVKQFIDPVLHGTATGRWDPTLSAWSG